LLSRLVRNVTRSVCMGLAPSHYKVIIMFEFGNAIPCWNGAATPMWWRRPSFIGFRLLFQSPRFALQRADRHIEFSDYG
jgi:hypothetical protein